MTHTLRIEKQSGHNSSAADENDVFPVQIVRKRLWDGEVTPPGMRYDATDDEVQKTNDGGSTWIPDPANDPRHSDAFRLDPLDTADPKCDAAANMAAYTEFYINSILDAGGYAFIAASTTIDLALIVTGIGVIADLILIVAEAIVGIGLTAIGDEFTSDIYDQLACIFYCHIGENGQVNAAQLDLIKSDVAGNISGAPAAVMGLLFDLWGEVVLSNAGAAGSETGDCADCGCNQCLNLLSGFGLQGWDYYIPSASNCFGLGSYRETEDDCYSDTHCVSPAQGYLAAGIGGVLDFVPTYLAVNYDLHNIQGSVRAMRILKNGTQVRVSTTVAHALNQTAVWDISGDGFAIGDAMQITIEEGAGSGIVESGSYVSINAIQICENAP